MKEDFLGSFLGNNACARIIRVFVFNREEAFTPAELAKRSGVKGKAVAQEIKALEHLGIIKRGKRAEKAQPKAVQKKQGTKTKSVKAEPVWSLDPGFKHLTALSSFIHEVSPMKYGNIVNSLRSSGRLAAVILSGCFMGDLTRPVDLIVAADNLNEDRLEHALKAFEPLFGREIRYSAFSTPEFRYRLTIQDHLLRDTLDYPHLVLLDRMRLL